MCVNVMVHIIVVGKVPRNYVSVCATTTRTSILHRVLIFV